MPGFLKSQPRMNVALTRCKKGMVVVSDKCFLNQAGKSTLLGKLWRTWSRHDAHWISRKAMLNNSVALPGLPLRLPPPSPSQLHGMLSPAAPLSSTSQQVQALARIDEQSRLNLIQNLNLLSTMLQGVPPSEPQTRTRTHTGTTHPAPASTSAAGSAPASASANKPSGGRRSRKTGKATNPVGPPVPKGRRGRGGGSAPKAATVQQDDTFPNLRELATALDQPSRHRSSKGR
jgi:hypothetical protein